MFSQFNVKLTIIVICSEVVNYKIVGILYL